MLFEFLSYAAAISLSGVRMEDGDAPDAGATHADDGGRDRPEVAGASDAPAVDVDVPMIEDEAAEPSGLQLEPLDASAAPRG